MCVLVFRKYQFDRPTEQQHVGGGDVGGVWGQLFVVMKLLDFCEMFYPKRSSKSPDGGVPGRAVARNYPNDP